MYRLMGSWMLFAAGLAAQQPEEFVVTPKRFDADNPRTLASAQVVLGAWVSKDGGREIGFDWAGEPLRLRLTQSQPEGRWDRLARCGSELAPVAVELDMSQGFANLDLRPLGLPAWMMVWRRGEDWHGTVRTLHDFRARVPIADVPYVITWIDMDLSCSASRGDRWVAVPAKQFDGLSLGSAMFVANEGAEPWYVGERVLELGDVRADGDVVLRLGRASEPQHEFLRRRAKRVNARFFASFDRGRAAFCKQYDIDPDRPLSKEPLTWFYCHDFEEAWRYAERVGKPLYCELTSDGCPWCKRYPWLNDRDPAVQQALSGYALVRLDRDLDRSRTGERLELQGVPKVLVFRDRADREPDLVIGGWLPPKAQVQKLAELAGESGAADGEAGVPRGAVR